MVAQHRDDLEGSRPQDTGIAGRPHAVEPACCVKSGVAGFPIGSPCVWGTGPFRTEDGWTAPCGQELLPCRTKRAPRRTASRVTGNRGSDENTGTCGHLHTLLAPAIAPASVTASLISSTVRTVQFVFPSRKPWRSRNEPFGRTATNSALPSGSRFSAIFPPGRIPRCWSISLPNVTWPRVVTVSLSLQDPFDEMTVMHPWIHSTSCHSS
jgi:hypothetical protein